MRTIVVSGKGAAAAVVADEIARQGGRAILLQEGASDHATRPQGGIEVVASRLLGVRGAPGSMLALTGKGEMECSAVIVVNDLHASPPDPPAVPLRSLLEGLPKGTVVLDLRGGPDRSGRALVLEAAITLLAEGNMVIVLADEVLAYGRDELLYRQAQRAGALFVRPGALEWKDNVLIITEPITGSAISVIPTVFVSESDVEEPLADLGTVSMGPLATLRRGVLRVRANLLDEELTTEARAAATIALGQSSAACLVEVEDKRCSACLTCVRICPFGAPYMNAEGKASIDTGRCQACGKCVAACAGKAISMPGATDQELDGRIMAAMEER